MRIRSIASLLAVGLVHSASLADFQGVSTETKIDDLTIENNLFVLNVYANFDDENDRVDGVGFAKIVTVGGGGFYQHGFGQETAPQSFLIRLDALVQYDTFVTIGVKHTDEAPQGIDGTTLDKQYVNLGDQIYGGWYNNDPDSGQGDATAGQVLIGQFTIQNPSATTSMEGIMTIFWEGESTGGAIVEEIVYFSGALSQHPPDADLDNDYVVGPADLAILLASWGPCVTDSCWADIDLDGTVGPADLAILLGNWGPLG